MQINQSNNQTNFQAKKIMTLKKSSKNVIDIYRLSSNNSKDLEFANLCYKTIYDSERKLNKYKQNILEKRSPLYTYKKYWQNFLNTRFANPNENNEFLVAIENSKSICGVTNYSLSHDYDVVISKINSFLTLGYYSKTIDGLILCILKDIDRLRINPFLKRNNSASDTFQNGYLISLPQKTLSKFFQMDIENSNNANVLYCTSNRLLDLSIRENIQKRIKHNSITLYSEEKEDDLREILGITSKELSYSDIQY